MPNKQTGFAQQLQELEAIADWFSSDDVELDQALAKFERAMVLAAGLEKHLASVKNKVEVIKKKFSAGGAGQPAVDGDGPDEPTEDSGKNQLPL